MRINTIGEYFIYCDKNCELRIYEVTGDFLDKELFQYIPGIIWYQQQGIPAWYLTGTAGMALIMCVPALIIGALPALWLVTGIDCVCNYRQTVQIPAPFQYKNMPVRSCLHRYHAGMILMTPIYLPRLGTKRADCIPSFAASNFIKYSLGLGFVSLLFQKI